MNSPVSLPETAPTSVTEALAQLRHAGAINGLALCRSSTLLVNWLPYTKRRAQTTVSVVHELTLLLRRHDRKPSMFRFQWQRGGMVVVVFGDLRLILLHADPREAAIIGAAAESLLNDLDELWHEPGRSKRPSHKTDETKPEAPEADLPTDLPGRPRPGAESIPIAPEPSGQLGRIIHPDRTHTWFKGAPQHRDPDAELSVQPGPG